MLASQLNIIRSFTFTKDRSFSAKSCIFYVPSTFRIVQFQEPSTFQHFDRPLSAGQSTSHQKIYKRPFSSTESSIFDAPFTFGIVQFLHFEPSTVDGSLLTRLVLNKREFDFFSDFGTHLHKNQFQSVSISFNQFFMDFVV